MQIISNKGLVFKTDNEFLKLSQKKLNNLIKISKGLEEKCLKGKYANDQKAQEKIPNIISH